MKWSAVMVSCRERSADRAATLADLYASDWRELVRVVVDDEAQPMRLARIRETWRRALEQAGDESADFVLLLEDDVRFDKRIRAKLETWKPVLEARGKRLFASLYNNMNEIGLISQDREGEWATGPAEFFWGGQAIVMTPRTAQDLADRWQHSTSIYPDERMGRLAESSGLPIYYRRPGLVRHVGLSTWNPVRRIIGYPVG